MVKAAAPSSTEPIAIRLVAGPKASAAHPNSVIPITAQAIVPVLNTPKTLASRVLGVRSCRDAETRGVINPELPPTNAIKTAATIIDRLPGRTSTAPPPMAAPIAAIHMRWQMFACCFQNNQAVVPRIPRLKEDQSQPKATESTFKIRSPTTGNR